jgi:hypothetical protein
MDELLTYQYFTLEDGVEVRSMCLHYTPCKVGHLETLQKVLDISYTSLAVRNQQEAWIEGQIHMR